MNIDLLPILNKDGEKIEFDSPVIFEEDDILVDSIIKGEVVNFAEQINITAKIDCVVKTNCAKCLKSLEIPLSMDVSETVGEDEITLDGTMLDITDIAVRNIFVSLQIRYLCSEDCKGLCSSCGADLNKSVCNCEVDVIDERFAKLKDLLK